MTDHTHQFSTVTVPVGLGGKSNPYIADPAPTLLVELASVDRAKEEAKAATLVREAEAAATAVRAEAEAAAAALLAEAEETAASLVAEARGEVEAIIASARDEAVTLRSDAEESIASTIADVEARQAELEERASLLDALQSELEQREQHLTERIAAVDAEAAEATALLSSAHSDADGVRAQASIEAEEILETARRQAEDEARQMIAEARSMAENDTTLEDRIAEIESVHRIEVQVLHDREVELLGRIADLEARIARPSPATTSHALEPTPRDDVVAASPEVSDDEGRREETVDHDSSLAIDLEGDHADVTVRSDVRQNGRHASEKHPTDRSSGPSPITTHAPLTEQLSTSAFRAVPESDRRGRRRR